MTSVWYLRKNQYKTCPNIEVAQMKDSIIVLCLDGEKSWLNKFGLSFFYLKFTKTCSSTEIGWPFNDVGSYFHCNTAFSAGAINSGCPLMARARTTLPCSSMIASTTTVPCMRACRAKGGYSGLTE